MIPGQVHSWDFENEPNGFIVNFSEKYINSLISNPRYLDQFTFFSGIANEQVITIPAEGQTRLSGILETIIREGNSMEELKDDMARAALIQLFIQVNRYTNRHSGNQQNNYNSLLFRNFQKLIDLHYKEKKLTKDYAGVLYVTPNHLNALSKEVSGKSAGELIRDRVILEAKRLLINAQMTVAEIAVELDFIDNSYFSKFFKKYVGVAPEVFRKQIIEK
jgi:AraC-like DNA-binding protein